MSNTTLSIEQQAVLSDFTTFRLGGMCPALLSCQSPEQLKTAVEYCAQNNLEFILIGGGSNLVVSDHGVDCHVIRYLSETPLIERHGDDLIVSGSTLLDDLVQYAAANGLDGLNYASGIPGTVGGAVVGNAGAFGKQVGDVVKSVEILCRGQACLSPTALQELHPHDLQFTYRNSILKKTGDIVVSVRFSLKSGDSAMLQKQREEILALRREKHPDLVVKPSAGSFFRNIEPTSSAERRPRKKALLLRGRQAAGWFLDQAGGMKLTSGGAKVFEKHANIIVKTDDCCAQDVFDLSEKMQQLVKDKFNFDLIREVRFAGKFDGMPEGVGDVIW